MNGARIVAICLVRNEELYLGQMLANIHDFCDEILIAEHGSADDTAAIARQWAERRRKVVFRAIRHPRESHAMIEPYAGTPTWIFAVDGDELYDPAGLQAFRAAVLAGTYDAYWQVSGNVLNCVRLDRDAGQAAGYLSPPCRSITKLFNFNAIVSWTAAEGERLHGGRLVFKPGYDEARRFPLHERQAWDASAFRCLHLCFMPRSRLDRLGRDGRVSRWNLAEQQGHGVLIKLYAGLLQRLGRYRASRWKQDRYARGALVTRPVAPFFERAPQP